MNQEDSQITFNGEVAPISSHDFLVSTTPQVSELLAADAVVAVGVSGGKDSVAAALRLAEYLDSIGHAGPRLLIHADLGTVEWKDSLPTCQRLAEQIGWELAVVQRKAGDLMHRWKQRWEKNVVRYANLECVKLILPWSTPSMRFCTSELKTSVICSYLSKRFKGRDILSVTGVRHQESSARAKMPISKPQTLLTKNGAIGLNWNAIITWSTEEVFGYIDERQGPLHEAYSVYGSSRVSCAFCIMGSKDDLAASASCPDNHEIYCEMVEIEATSTYALQGSSWLADVAPHLLPRELLQRIHHAKLGARRRELMESQIPNHLLYTNGWPTVMPTYKEAVLLAEIRGAVASAVGISIQYSDPESILDRYAELMRHAQTTDED